MESGQSILRSDSRGQQRTGSAIIFNKDFQVENLENPQAFLPQYQQQKNQEISCVEQCNICCGNICIGFAYCCAMICCCKCASCIYQLETSKAGLIEQFGKFSRLLKPGINMVNPCSQTVREIDLKIKILTLGSSQCITKDNVKTTITSSIAFRITNPITSYYVLGGNIQAAIGEVIIGSIRSVVGEEILDEVLRNRIKIVTNARQIAMKSLPSGISLERIFMNNIQIHQEVIDDLAAAARQRRISQANIIMSQAQVQTAKLMQQSARLLDNKAAMQIRYLQIVQNLGKNDCKLIMPIGINKKGFKQ